jgi:hypothetical protein
MDSYRNNYAELNQKKLLILHSEFRNQDAKCSIKGILFNSMRYLAGIFLKFRN